MKTFTEYINENYTNDSNINEKKILSPQNVKAFGLNRNSVKKLKAWKHKFKDVEYSISGMEYFAPRGHTPYLFDWLSGDRQDWEEIRITTNQGVDFKINFKNTGTLKLDDSVWGDRRIYFELDKRTFGTHIDFEDDKIAGLYNLMEFLFKKFGKEIYQRIQEAISLDTLYVIKAGKIAPRTGKTEHGWSIYDNPQGMLGVIKGSLSVLWNADDYKVGDKFKILDDQTHKLLWNEVEIEELIPATYKDYVAYSRKRGLEVPVAPFKKQPGRGRLKLYSIK